MGRSALIPFKFLGLEGPLWINYATYSRTKISGSYNYWWVDIHSVGRYPHELQVVPFVLRFYGPSQRPIFTRTMPLMANRPPRLLGVCFYCGNALSSKAIDPSHLLTKDHIFPKRVRAEMNAKGLRGKCVDACRICNSTKGQLTLEEFRAVMAVRMQVIPVPEFKFAGEQREG